MKKIFLMAIMALVTMSVSAQLITTSRTVKGERAHNWWVDLGAGGYTGDMKDAGVGFDFGLRYTKMWGNVGWDVLKLSAQSHTKHFKAEDMDVQLKTGVRYISAPVSGDIKVYGNVAAGFWCDFNENAPTFLVWELGAGVMLNDRVSVGLVFNHHTMENDYGGDDISIGYLAGRLSIAL